MRIKSVAARLCAALLAGSLGFVTMADSALPVVAAGVTTGTGDGSVSRTSSASGTFSGSGTSSGSADSSSSSGSSDSNAVASGSEGSSSSSGSHTSSSDSSNTEESAVSKASSINQNGSENGNTTADPASNRAGELTTREEEETIHITSIYDLQDVAERAHFDKWSRDKRIVLDVDLDLAGTDIRLASFGGTFDGQNHTISNLTINSKVACAGLFDTIQETGLVENLHVTGSIRPSGEQDRIGGIAGTNNGTIRNCTFEGTIEADAQVGGIVGRNETSGIVRNCSSLGDITGRSYTGGICGYNAGTLTSCTSGMSVNTTYTDTTVSVDELSNTVENIVMTGRINTTENVQAKTDSGGVAGYSSGVISRCVNQGTVGYEHVGYNVGGVAGRSSGYLEGCQNSGEIKGRKDVGGIVGQQQPYLRLEFTEDTLSKLEKQFDQLQDTTDSLLDSTDAASGNINSHLNRLSGLAKNANDYVKTMGDAAQDDANEAAQTTEQALKDMQDQLRQTTDYIDELASEANHLNDLVLNFIETVELSDTERDKIRTRIDAIKDHLDTAEQAGKDINDLLTDQSKRAADRLGQAFDDTTTILENLALVARDYYEIFTILSQTNNISYTYTDENGNSRTITNGQEALIQYLKDNDSDFKSTLDALTDAIQYFSDSSNWPPANEDAIQTAITKALNGVIAETMLVYRAFFDQTFANNVAAGVNKILADNPDAFKGDYTRQNETTKTQREVLTEDAASLSTDVSDINKCWEDLQAVNNKISGDLNDKLPDEIDNFNGYVDTIVDRLSDIGDRAKEIEDILEDHIDEIPDYIDTGIYQDLQQLITTAGSTTEILQRLQQTLDNVSNMSVIANGVNGEITDAGNNLYGAVNDIVNLIQSLNTDLSGSSSTIISQARSLNDQINDIAHTLEDGLRQDEDDDDPLNQDDDDDSDDPIQDDSDIDYTGVTQGRTTNCLNRGEVNADNNVGGIVGTIGVEYDLDPEKDIAQVGSSTLDYNFFARSIVDHCVNRGEVESKNNYCGGIAAHMEMGYVDASENYGKIKGGADYTGGISGYSVGTIRDSYAKCDVSGERYVGGIAGYAVRLYDNTSMISISDSTQYSGAIAGMVKDIDKNITGNLFVATNLRGIDNVSYDGKAQGTTYKKLQERENLPEEYDILHLTFTADDETVAVLDVPFGESVSADQLPDVPDKAGFIGKWERTTFTRVTRDLTIKAIYTRRLDVVTSSAVREGGSPIMLAEGSFSQKDTLGLIPETTEGRETERWLVSVPTEAGVTTGAADAGTAEAAGSGQTEADADNTHTFRYLAVDGSTEHTSLYLVKEDGSKQKLDTGTNGKYLTFEVSGNQFELAVVTEENGAKEEIELAAGIAGGAAIVVLLLLAHRRRKKRARRKQQRASAKNKSGQQKDKTK